MAGCQKFLVGVAVASIAMAMPMFTNHASVASAAVEVKQSSTVSFKDTPFQYLRVGHLALSHDNSIAAFDADADICVVDLKSGKPIQKFVAKTPGASSGRFDIYAVSISLDNQWIYTIDENSDLVAWKIVPGEVKRNAWNKGELGARMNLDPNRRAQKPYRTAGFSRSGRHCALGGNVFSLEPQALVLETGGSAVSFSSDGLHVIAYGGELGQNAEIYTWNSSEFELVRTFEHRSSWYGQPHFGAIAYDPARDLVAQKMDGGVGLWSLDSTETLATVSFQVPDHVEFSPGGEIVWVRSAQSGGYSMGGMFKTEGLESLRVSAYNAAIGRDGRGFVIAKKGLLTIYGIDVPPPYLEVEVAFDDAISGGNGVLDSGETANVVLKVSNTGGGSAVGIVVKATVDAPSVVLPDSVSMGGVPAGCTRELRIPVAALISAESGTVHIGLATTEINGFDAQTLEFDLSVHRVEPPMLSIVGSPVVTDVSSPPVQSGMEEVADQLMTLARLSGNGNGVLENGETARVAVPIRNTGQGVAYGVVIDVSSPSPFVTFESNQAGAGDIAPGSDGSAEIVVNVAKGYPGDILELPAIVRDVRPAIPPVEANIAVPYVKREPQIEFAYQIHDGGTESSRGNGDGRIEQGEFIELAMSLMNVGTAAAEHLTARLSTNTGNVAIDKGDVSVGELMPSAAIDLAFTFMIKRGQAPGPLPMKLDFEMADYPTYSTMINYVVSASGAAEVDLKPIGLAEGDAVWMPVHLGKVGEVLDLVLDPLDQNTIYIATERKGVLISEDRGLSWSAFAGGLESESVRCLSLVSATPRVLLAGTSRGGIYRLDFEDDTWKQSNKGIKEQDGVYPTCRTFETERPESREICLGTSQGMYVSDNTGKKWSRIKKLDGVSILDVAMLGGLSGSLFVGTGNGVFQSGDKGKNWVSIASAELLGGIVEKILDLAVSPDGLFAATGSAGLYRSLDGGKEWSALDLVGGGAGHMPSISIGTVLINPINPMTVYAGANDGSVYESRDSGDTWQTIGYGVAGIGDESTRLLRIDETGMLYAGGGSGLQRLADVKLKHALGSVLFGSASSDLLSDVIDGLSGVVDLLLGNAALQVIVEGHTDNVGDEVTNRKLSQERADAVLSYLVGLGISQERLSAKGFGWDRPVSFNETPDGREKNRRVEVLIVGPK